MASKCCTVDELLSFALFTPPPPLSQRPNQFHVQIPRPHPGIVFSPHVNSADSQRGGGGGGGVAWVALCRAFPQTQKLGFLMNSLIYLTSALFSC